MADEIPAPQTVVPTAPTWDTNLQNMVKLLMQSQKSPSGTADQTSAPEAAQVRASDFDPYNPALAGLGNLPAPPPHGGDVASAVARGKLPVAPVMPMGQVGEATHTPL